MGTAQHNRAAARGGFAGPVGVALGRDAGRAPGGVPRGRGAARGGVRVSGASGVSGAGLLPFSAVVGQDDARTALLLGAVDPGLGGVLLTGEKGTAKTTLVRALAAILPGISVVPGCRFSCDPARPGPAC